MSDSFEELSARARRGDLSRAEQEQLRWHLKTSAEARLWHEAGRQADAEDAVLPGDHDAVARVMRRTLASVTPVKSRPRKRLLSLAAASLLVASVAAASVAGFSQLRRPQSRLASAPSAPSARATPAPASALAPVAESAAVPVSVPDPVAALGAPATSSASAREHEATGAAALFSAAALARREGNIAKSIALLDKLRARYPGSREARQSQLTLGALHLKRGSAEAALRHFEAYSQASAQGALAPEALWGQFQALSALGRNSEARQRLSQLVERFPSSTYAGVARAKLELE